MKLNLILDHKRESPESVDAAESPYLFIQFIRNLSKSTDIVKGNVENFFLNFFNWMKEDCITIRSLKDGHFGVILLGHFANKSKPVVFFTPSI